MGQKSVVNKEDLKTLFFGFWDYADDCHGMCANNHQKSGFFDDFFDDLSGFDLYKVSFLNPENPGFRTFVFSHFFD